MEVLIPVDKMDFDFNSARSSPSVSAPPSPKRFGEYYCSAPTSPSHLSQFYRDFDESTITSGGGSGGGVPFDFAFDVSEESETASLSAEELFDGGVIKPLTLKPPPRLQLPSGARINPKSPRGKKIFKDVFSPRNKKENDDPFEIAARNATKTLQLEPERGRQRSSNLSSSSSRRATRSLSPLRDSQYPWGEEFQFSKRVQEENISTISEVPVEPRQQQHNNTKHLCSSLSSSSSKSHKKWRFKDFFLFRSASEGRASDKDPLKKYTAVPFRRQEDLKNSSFRTIDSPGSGSGTRRRGPVSAHELHYTINRSVSEDLKKKTFLPYKQGILGRLSFNPAVHALANGFGFSRK